MASYTVLPAEKGAHEKTLVASTVDTVTFSVGGDTTVVGWANVPKRVEILTDGAADIYYTKDGSTPSVGGNGTYRIPAAGGSTIFDTKDSNDQDPVVIKLISAGTPKYSVQRAD